MPAYWLVVRLPQGTPKGVETLDKDSLGYAGLGKGRGGTHGGGADPHR